MGWCWEREGGDRCKGVTKGNWSAEEGTHEKTRWKVGVGWPETGSLAAHSLPVCFSSEHLVPSGGLASYIHSHSFASQLGTGPACSRCSINTAGRVCLSHKCLDWSLETLSKKPDPSVIEGGRGWAVSFRGSRAAGLGTRGCS